MNTEKIVDAKRPVSSLHRFMPYRGDRIDADTVATGCVLVGMLGFVCLLFVHCLKTGVLG